MNFHPNLIAVHCAELILKGHNRASFTDRLVQQIGKRLAPIGLPGPIRRRGARLLIEIGAERDLLPQALQALGEIPGIAAYFPAQSYGWNQAGEDDDTLANGPVRALLLDLAYTLYRPGARFAVRVERHTPERAISARGLERKWGRAILEETPWPGVNLSAPDCIFHVALYPEGVLVYARRHTGLGGLPVGSSGRVLALLSGGIDSPVAAFLMARRGCTVNCLHFSASYLDRDRADATPVGRLAAQLSRYTQRLDLTVVPYTAFDLALTGPAGGYELMLFRRFMVRVAEQLARTQRTAALVTGDSLGQVASQTLENLTTLNAVATRPIFRPLIGFNKQEIIDFARRIGTYNISIEPYKDCCALIARRPKTRTQPDRLAVLEAKRLPDYPGLIDTVLGESVRLHFVAGRLADTP